MRARTVAGLLAGCVALAAPSAAEAQSCKVKGSRTVAQNDSLRVYTKGTHKDPLGRRHKQYWGCVIDFGGRPHRFNQRGAVGLLRLDGSGLVLYRDVYPNRSRQRFATLRVADFNSSQSTRGPEAFLFRYTGPAPTITDAEWHVDETDGSLSGGFIGTADKRADAYEVRSFARFNPLAGGAIQLLENEPLIDPRSLTLRGRTLRWTHSDGQTKTAPLPDPQP